MMQKDSINHLILFENCVVPVCSFGEIVLQNRLKVKAVFSAKTFLLTFRMMTKGFQHLIRGANKEQFKGRLFRSTLFAGAYWYQGDRIAGWCCNETVQIAIDLLKNEIVKIDFCFVLLMARKKGLRL